VLERTLVAYANRRSRLPERIAGMLDRAIFLGSRRKLSVHAIRDIATETVPVTCEIRPSSVVHAYSPRRFSTDAVEAPAETFPLPARRFRVMRDVLVAATSTSIFSSTACLVPEEAFRRRREIRVEGDGVLFRGVDAVVRSTAKPVQTVQDGLFLGGRGADNWYHFIVEILPRLHLLRSDLPEVYRDIPLLVPEAVLASRPSREMIEMFAPKAEIVPLSSHSMARVERLLWIDVPVRSAYKLDRWVSIEPAHEAIDVGFFREFRAKILSLSTIPAASPSQSMLFLDRGPQDARPYNREAILNIAADFGFSCVNLGGLGAREQVAAVANSRLLFGPHGAAWTSMLFATPDAKALTITPRLRRVEGFSGFQNLAAVSDVRLRDLAAEPTESSWSISVDVLRPALEEMLDGDRNW